MRKVILLMETNLNATKNGGLIYTTGLDKGIPIGCLQENDGKKVLIVKDHRKTDYIRIEELVTILMEYQYNNI